MKTQIRTSTKFMLLALVTAGVSAVMTAPGSAQKASSSGSQTCANPSEARDQAAGPDTRCLRKPKEGQSWEQWWEQRGADNAKKTAPNGQPRRFDTGRQIHRDDGSVVVFHDGPRGGLGSITQGGYTRNYTTPGTVGGGSSKGKKPR
jgi:hypothetical protein